MFSSFFFSLGSGLTWSTCHFLSGWVIQGKILSVDCLIKSKHRTSRSIILFLAYEGVTISNVFMVTHENYHRRQSGSQMNWRMKTLKLVGLDGWEGINQANKIFRNNIDLSFDLLTFDKMVIGGDIWNVIWWVKFNLPYYFRQLEHMHHHFKISPLVWVQPNT